MTKKELIEQLKQIVREKTAHGEDYVVQYLIPVIEKYIEEKKS